ncbi:MAG: plastocyanin [Synechococcales bacterium]|nr:plastocyanin [Synechococcales bacterium]
MKSLASIMRQVAIACFAAVLLVGGLFWMAAPANAAEYTVKMGTAKGLVFDPPIVNIKAGDTVTWNVGSLPPHNVVFEKTPGDAALAASLSHKGLEGAGKTFSVTFPADAPAGDYSYFCMPHRGAGMVGKIKVS